MNFYIDFHQTRINAATTQKQLDAEKQRSMSRAAGMLLNRGFNEDADTFYSRKPEFKEFIEWNKNIAQNITLVATK